MPSCTAASAAEVHVVYIYPVAGVNLNINLLWQHQLQGSCTAAGDETNPVPGPRSTSQAPLQASAESHLLGQHSTSKINITYAHHNHNDLSHVANTIPAAVVSSVVRSHPWSPCTIHANTQTPYTQKQVFAGEQTELLELYMSWSGQEYSSGGAK